MNSHQIKKHGFFSSIYSWIKKDGSSLKDILSQEHAGYIDFGSQKEDVDIKYFDTFCELQKIKGNTIGEFMKEIIRIKEIKKYHFEDKTHLGNFYYNFRSKKMSKEEAKSELQILVSIGVGLNLGVTLTKKLVESVGLSFGTSKREKAYLYLLEHYGGNDINKCNEFLGKIGIEKECHLLGN